MSPVFQSKCLPALQPWRNIQHTRQKSTLQEINSQDGERTAAILHGQRKREDRKTQRNQPSGVGMHNHPVPHQTASATPNVTSKRKSAQSSPHQPTLRQSSKFQGHGRSKLSHHKSQHQQHGQINMDKSKKRKADASLDQRPARRNRHEQPKLVLKDEAYIRRTMHVPTSQDYPGAPKNIFKAPKTSINDGIQGLAEIKEEFTEIGKDVWRCSVTFESASYKEVVDAEGRSKVGQHLCRLIAYLL